ncbi:MAG: hypothetical protein IJZ30_00190 [Alphaproteobacteria bacterium]|nr:hypothetical protein [Alphaproteobacteria bacterium]
MAKRSDFDRFLEANFPEDYMKIKGEGVAEDVVTSIYSKHERHYHVWKIVPEWIKSFYGDTLPDEVFGGQEPWDRFVEYTEQKVLRDIPYDVFKVNQIVYSTVMTSNENMKYCAETLEKGYSFEASLNLTYKHDELNKIFESGEYKTEEGRKKIRKIRSDSKNIIEQDWKEVQPHKYVFHEIKEYDRIKRRREKTDSLLDKLKLTIEACKARRQVNIYMEKVKDEELKTKLQKLNETVKRNHTRLETKNLVNNVREYMEEKSSKSGARKIDRDALSILRANMNKGDK